MHGCEVTALAYLRWWSNGWLDLLTVHGQQDAIGHRISGIATHEHDFLRTARLRWILRADVVTASQELRQLAPPSTTSTRISMCPGDRHVAALQERGLVPDPQRSLTDPAVG